jgi:hypothetical protein
MRLYHYTGWDHVAGIEASGITEGGIYLILNTGPLAIRNVQWLTENGDWFGQNWATQHVLKGHERTTVRFQVVIPKTARADLWRWNDYAKAKLHMPSDYLAAFNEAGGSDGRDWWVFAGRIPRGWLRGMEERPQPPRATVAV